MWRPCQFRWPDAKKEDVTLDRGARSVTRSLRDGYTFWRDLTKFYIWSWSLDFLGVSINVFLDFFKCKWIKIIYEVRESISRKATIVSLGVSTPSSLRHYMLLSLLKWPGLTRFGLWTQTLLCPPAATFTGGRSWPDTEWQDAGWFTIWGDWNIELLHRHEQQDFDDTM